MDIRETERVCDRIYAAQPNLLGSVLAQRSLGVSMPTIDVLLNVLIVLYLAIEESGQVLAIVSGLIRNASCSALRLRSGSPKD